MEKKNRIIIIFLAVFSVLLVFFGIGPILNGIKTDSKELLSQKENLAIYDNRLSNLEEFKTVYKGLGEILEKIDALFINADVPLDFIGFIEDLEKECKVNAKISAGSTGKDNRGWSFITFQMNTTSSFNNFIEFFEKIENSPYLIEASNLSLSKGKGSDIAAVFSLKVYAK